MPHFASRPDSLPTTGRDRPNVATKPSPVLLVSLPRQQLSVARVKPIKRVPQDPSANQGLSAPESPSHSGGDWVILPYRLRQ